MALVCQFVYNVLRYITSRVIVDVILSFQGKDAQRIWWGERLRRPDWNVQRAVRRKLRMLNNASGLNDLREPPRNRLETLRGNRQGQFSIRVNDQWRICFRWHNGNVLDVELVDYHH